MTTTTIFAQVPTWVITADIPANAFRVYVAMATYAGSDRLVWPSIDTLASMCGLKRRAVIRQIAVLRDAGLIRSAGIGNHTGVRRYQLAWDAPFPVQQGGVSSDTGVRKDTPSGDDGGVSSDTGGVYAETQGGVSSDTGGVSPATPELDHRTIQRTDKPTHNARARNDEPQQPTSTLQSVVGIDTEDDLKNERSKAKNAPAEADNAPHDLVAAILDAITETLTECRPLTADEHADVVRVIRRYASETPTAHVDELEALARSWANAWADGRLTSAGGSLSWTLRAGRLPVSEKPAPNLPGYRDTPWGPEGMINLITGEFTPSSYDWRDDFSMEDALRAYRGGAK
jgi:hypothetical protein